MKLGEPILEPRPGEATTETIVEGMRRERYLDVLETRLRHRSIRELVCWFAGVGGQGLPFP